MSGEAGARTRRRGVDSGIWSPFRSLLLAQVMSAALGLVFWVLVARLVDAHDVGVAAAAIFMASAHGQGIVGPPSEANHFIETPRGWVHPKTSWGEPDIQATLNMMQAANVPLERCANSTRFGGPPCDMTKRWWTEEEYKQRLSAAAGRGDLGRERGLDPLVELLGAEPALGHVLAQQLGGAVAFRVPDALRRGALLAHGASLSPPGAVGGRHESSSFRLRSFASCFSSWANRFSKKLRYGAIHASASASSTPTEDGRAPS